MNRVLHRVLVLVLGALIWGMMLPGQADAQQGRRFAARRGPWIVYRYPVFREGNRPPAARNHAQPYYWPYDAYERYPQFYGGLHARYFDDIGFPSGSRGLRGWAW